MSNALTRFETIGNLYYRRYSRLRPGKLSPFEDTSSDENRTQFDQWFATQSFTDAIDRIEFLEKQLQGLAEHIEKLNDQLDEMMEHES